MRLLLTLSLFLFFFTIGYLQEVTKAKETRSNEALKNSSVDIHGAYTMLRQVINDGARDSITTAKEFKIYTGRYMMYAGSGTAGDSLATYGIGTYSIQNGKVIEHVFYTASGGAHNDIFEIRTTKTGDQFSQVFDIPADASGRTFRVTEDYKSVGKRVTSPLDGAWKQTKRMYLPKNGSATTDNHPTQFKVYQSGYFIWANTSLDSATNKPASYFGYGSFQMNGRHKSTEVNNNSSFVTDLVDKPVTLQLHFNGKDAYQQTITYANGNRSVEFYQRLK